MATEEQLKRLMTGPEQCFATLPTEIRIRIYEYALDIEVFTPYGLGPRYHEIEVTDLLPAMSFVDVSLQVEAEQVLYRINTIVLTFHHFRHWIIFQKLPRAHLRMEWLKRLLVTFTSHDHASFVPGHGGALMGCGVLEDHQVSQRTSSYTT